MKKRRKKINKPNPAGPKEKPCSKKSCTCEKCMQGCELCGGKNSDHIHEKHKNVPTKKNIKQYREKGAYPRRIWPTDSELQKKKGPKF